MSVVLKILNYISSGSKIHCQFKNFVESLEYNIPNDVPWYCLVRWLSVNNVLTKFFDLLEPIKIFLKEKEKNFPQLLNPQWLRDMSFFTDVVHHLATLNMSLQGQNKFINNLVQDIFSFQNKLKLFQRDLRINNLNHFPNLKHIEDCLIWIATKLNCEDYVLTLKIDLKT